MQSGTKTVKKLFKLNKSISNKNLFTFYIKTAFWINMPNFNSLLLIESEIQHFYFFNCYKQNINKSKKNYVKNIHKAYGYNILKFKFFPLVHIGIRHQ